MPVATVNDIKIAFERVGDPADPAVIFLMGLGGQLVMWPDRLIDAVVKAGYQAILPDNRDIGLSTSFAGKTPPNPLLQIMMRMAWLPGGAPYSLSDIVDDTVGLADHLQLGPFHLVGVSMGGMVAQLTAARHPDRVLSLTAISTTTGNPLLAQTKPDISRKLAMRSAPAATREEAVRQSLAGFALFGTPGEDHATNGTRERLERAYDRSYDPDARRRQLAAILETGNFCRESRRIKTPTLVLHGTEDPLIPIAGGRDVARCIANSRLVELQGMGHDLAPRFLNQIAQSLTGHLRSSEAITSRG